MPLSKELRRTSRDSFESDSDSRESWYVRLNSFKSGILRFFDSIDSIIISIRWILRLSVVVDRPGNGKLTKNELAVMLGSGNSDKPYEHVWEDVMGVDRIEIEQILKDHDADGNKPGDVVPSSSSAETLENARNV